MTVAELILLAAELYTSDEESQQGLTLKLEVTKQGPPVTVTEKKEGQSLDKEGISECKPERNKFKGEVAMLEFFKCVFFKGQVKRRHGAAAFKTIFN